MIIRKKDIEHAVRIGLDANLDEVQFLALFGKPVETGIGGLFEGLVLS